MHHFNAKSFFGKTLKGYKIPVALGLASIFIASAMVPKKGQKDLTHIAGSVPETPTQISVFVPKKTACGFSYIDAMGATKNLTFMGLAERDTTILQSVAIASPSTFVWGFLQPNKGKPGLFLTRFNILVKPGDKINLALNHQMYLHSPPGQPSVFLADHTAPFYGQQVFGKGGKKLTEADGIAAYEAFNKAYYQNLFAAYQKELERLMRLKESGSMDAALHVAATLYAQSFFYEKLFVLIEENSQSKYPDLVLTFLKDHLAAAERLVNAPDLMLSYEVMRTMDGIVKAKLMAKGLDINNNLNLYEEAKYMDLGIYKSTYLARCLANYPAKQIGSYQSAVADFSQHYAQAGQGPYLEALLQQYNKKIALPQTEQFITTDNQRFKLSEIVQKVATPYVVVDFWASWCKPCRQQFPVIDSLKYFFKKQDIQVSFISVNMDEDKSKWLKAAKEEMKYLQQHSYHLENAKKSGFVKELNINAIPYVIVLKDGEIVANNFTLPVELSFTKDITALINQSTQKTGILSYSGGQ